MGRGEYVFEPPQVHADPGRRLQEQLQLDDGAADEGLQLKLPLFNLDQAATHKYGTNFSYKLQSTL